MLLKNQALRWGNGPEKSHCMKEDLRRVEMEVRDAFADLEAQGVAAPA